MVQILLWVMLALAVLDRAGPVQQPGGLVAAAPAGATERRNQIHRRAPAESTKPGTAAIGVTGSSSSGPQASHRVFDTVGEPKQADPTARSGDADSPRSSPGIHPGLAPSTPATAGQGGDHTGGMPNVETIPAHSIVPGDRNAMGVRREAQVTRMPNPQNGASPVLSDPIRVGQHQGAGDGSARQLSPDELDAVMGFVPPDPTTLPQGAEPIEAPPE